MTSSQISISKFPSGACQGLSKQRFETIPLNFPYLKAPAESPTITGLDKTNDHRRRVSGCVGLATRNIPRDRHRSIPLSIFKRLFETPNVRFVSLQQRLRPGDAEILAHYPNVDLETDRKGSSFADTAALISKLDLVITVDTAIGHLGGALGRPVWIMLAFFPYWVWLRGRGDSPWYPTARLFRQTRSGDWESVMERAGQVLDQVVSSRLAHVGVFQIIAATTAPPAHPNCATNTSSRPNNTAATSRESSNSRLASEPRRVHTLFEPRCGCPGRQ